VSAVPPTLSETAPLLLGGELGCRFRCLATWEVGVFFLAQRPARLKDATAQPGFTARELGSDVRSLCSPHSVP
jgi:hypothetical protein